MDADQAIVPLEALAQKTRLEAFRLLVTHEPAGLPAGEIARTLQVPGATMSVHLSILQRAGLVTSTRRSRSIIYRADLAALRATLMFLLKDCCQGRAELCQPLIEDLTSCRKPEVPSHADA